MTQLLVSVRSPDEAALALDAGVGVLDVKEPRAGSLGAARPEIIADVARLVASAGAGAPPLSVALGELQEWDQGGCDLASRIPSPVQFAKLGLAGMATQPDWPARWQAALARFPSHVAPVAVAYADAEAAAAPPVEMVWEYGRQFGCRVLLIDTYIKDGRQLLDHWELSRAQQWIERVQADAAQIALAGSLDLPAIDRLLPLGADFLAVRSAACDPVAGRAGQVCRQRLVEISRRFNQAPRRARVEEAVVH